jgi:ABC-type Fe3+ transport system permease subunit
MLTLILAVLALLTAVPAGLLIAWLTQEELRAGRKWFKTMAFGSVLGVVAGVFLKEYALMLTFAYIGVVSGISWKKSFCKD